VIITPELSHGDLAQMIGSSRPMVSRLMGEMAARHKIVRHGKQYILLEGHVPTKAASLSNGRNGSHAVLANSYTSPPQVFLSKPSSPMPN
jgi:Crp-like helix-turn-helix domain